MRIISWDVGIKHLAYCIIDKKDDNFKIIEWNNIDLSDKEKICCICKCKAKKYVINNILNKNEYYCCRHYKIKFTKSKQKCMKCCKKAIKEYNEYAWCSNHQNSVVNKIYKKIKIKNIKKKSCMKIQIDKLINRLYKKLNMNNNILNTDEVLIENQPSHKNPTMKTMSIALFSYFIIKGIEKKINYSVKFIAPSSKLKICLNSSKIINKANNKYKMTKLLGMEYCKALITIKDKAYLESFKKGDDLCDAFLQGFKYLFSPLPIKYFNKIKDILIK